MNPENVVERIEQIVGEGGTLLRLIVITWVLDKDGKLTELLIGSDNVDRTDLLCASQTLRISADNLYKMSLDMGMAAQARKN